MKYWFYSEGNILGPYEPAELLALPAFAEESLVCPESATGDNPGDWRPAAQVPEIASAMSVGAGRTIGAGVMSGAYEYETGFSASMRYFEEKEPGRGVGYGDLLDTIDNILGAYKEGQEAPVKEVPETDYDLAEKFDIRLSRIQEELEAARWEKNLLLEKIRLKDMEERKNRERIQDLEARLKGEIGKAETSVRELEQVRHLADLKEKAETIRKIEEIRKEELALRQDIVPAPKPAPAAQVPPAEIQAAEPPAAETPAEAAPAAEAPAAAAPAAWEPAAPVIERKSLKSMASSGEIRLEKAVGKEKEETSDAGLTSRKLKSLGQTQAPAYVYGAHYDKPLPGPEPAPPGAFKPENLEPLPQQAGGVVYDFTVVTAKTQESSQKFQIEPRLEPSPSQQAVPSFVAPAGAPQPVKPPTYDLGVQAAQQAPAAAPAPAPAPAPAHAPAPAAQPLAQHTFQFGAQPQAAAAQPAQFNSFQPSAAPAAAPAPAAAAPAPAPAKGPEAPADSPEKTLRVPMAAVKGGAQAPKAAEKPRRKGGKLAFITILVVFGSIAAGGLGYFFLGEGVSFSEFSMLSLGGKKKAPAMSSHLEPRPAAEPEAKPEPQAAQPEAQPEAAPEAQPQAAQPAPQPANENIRKALDIVKGYKLSGGRGTIATWFSNSFLSGASGGANEEWTATPLHGDILVVQYRLLRPKQEPLTYQFEVDAAKQDIVRGINNNAIDLLDSGKDKTVSAAPARKPAKAKVRKPAKPREVPILPLPEEEPSAGSSEQEPTGFENAQGEGSEKVKYLKAQESDEELF